MSLPIILTQFGLGAMGGGTTPSGITLVTSNSYTYRDEASWDNYDADHPDIPIIDTHDTDLLEENDLLIVALSSDISSDNDFQVQLNRIYQSTTTTTTGTSTTWFSDQSVNLTPLSLDMGGTLGTALFYCSLPSWVDNLSDSGPGWTEAHELVLSILNVGSGDHDYSVCSWGIYRGLSANTLQSYQYQTGSSGNPTHDDPKLTAGNLAIAVGAIDDDGSALTAPSGWTLATTDFYTSGTNTTSSSLGIAHKTDHSTGAQGSTAFNSGVGNDENIMYIAEFGPNQTAEASVTLVGTAKKALSNTQDSSDFASNDLPLPSGTTDGDLIVISLSSQSSGSTNVTPRLYDGDDNLLGIFNLTGNYSNTASMPYFGGHLVLDTTGATSSSYYIDFINTHLNAFVGMSIVVAVFRGVDGTQLQKKNTNNSSTNTTHPITGDLPDPINRGNLLVTTAHGEVYSFLSSTPPSGWTLAVNTSGFGNPATTSMSAIIYKTDYTTGDYSGGEQITFPTNSSGDQRASVTYEFK